MLFLERDKKKMRKEIKEVKRKRKEAEQCNGQSYEAVKMLFVSCYCCFC